MVDIIMLNVWEIYQARIRLWLTEFFSFGIIKKEQGLV